MGKRSRKKKRTRGKRQQKKNPKRKWIGKAIEKPGTLRATVRRRYGDKGFTNRGTIKNSVLTELSKEKGITGKRSRLALTLRKF